MLSLREAAQLLWPDNFITERTLRSAVAAGRLPISRVAGKFFVTRRALSALSRCEPLSAASEQISETAPPLFEKDLAAIRRMRGR
jgi:hypothetical protein